NVAAGNMAIGMGSLEKNTTGDWNSASGFNALNSNTTGSHNTAVGRRALFVNSTGNYNTAVGSSAGPGPGFDNLANTTALGYGAQTTASNQVRIGNSSVTSIGGYAPWSNLSDERFKTNIQAEIHGL